MNQSESTSRSNQPGTSPSRAVILLVDDDANDRALMKVLLTNETYQVIEASDAMEALDHFEKNSHDIDLLLTDVHMPGMDGVELAKKVLAKNPSVKILFASGFKHTFASDIDGHPVEFIEKSSQVTTLSKKVQELLFPTNPIKKLWQKVTARAESF